MEDPKKFKKCLWVFLVYFVIFGLVGVTTVKYLFPDVSVTAASWIMVVGIIFGWLSEEIAKILNGDKIK